MDLTRALNILSGNKKTPVVAAAHKEYINTPTVTCPHCDFEHLEVPQSGVIGCGNCGMPFQVILIRTATGKRVKEEKQTRDHIEYTKTFSTKPVKLLEKKPLPDIKSMEEAAELFKAKLLSAAEFDQLSLTHPEWKIWDLEHGRNPFNPEGDNRSRECGFIYSPEKHPKGMIYQRFVKPAIRKFINFCYGATRALYGKDKAGRFKRMIIRQILTLTPGIIEYANKTMQTQYDKDAFVFEDPFLIALRELMAEHTKKNFQWDNGNIEELLMKATDMALAHLKEDMPYRAKFKLLINDLIRRYPYGFELTDSEEKIQMISNEVTTHVKIHGGAYKFKMPVFK